MQGRMSAGMARAWAVCSGPSIPGMLAFAGSVVPTAQPFIEFLVLLLVALLIVYHLLLLHYFIKGVRSSDSLGFCVNATSLR